MLKKIISKADLETSFVPISKIESVNPLFTARYYNEYLGFEIAAQNDQGNEYLLTFKDQLLFIVGSKSGSKLEAQVILLQTNELEAHYYNLLSKVKIESILKSNKFDIIDCDDNTITFRTS